MGMRLKWLCLTCICLLFVGCFSGKSEPLLTIDGQEVTEVEVVLYFAKTYEDFVSLGGEDVWQIEDFSGGKSADKVAKQGAVDNLIKVKILTNIAKDREIVLDEADHQLIDEQALGYYNALSDRLKSSYDIQLDDVKQVFFENFLANQLESVTVSNYSIDDEAIAEKMLENNEYARLFDKKSRDVLTVYKVHHIVVYTHEKDSDGNWQPKDEAERKQAIERFDEAYQALLDGEDFFELVKEYSENLYFDVETDGLKLSKAQLPETLERAISALDIGEYSEPVQGEYGYHTFLMLSEKEPTEEEIIAYDEGFKKWESALKEEAIIKLGKSAFEENYNKWREAIDIEFSDRWYDLNYLDMIKVDQ